MTGPPGQPLRAGASVVDIMGGTFAVVAILAALRERDRTGKGQLVKSALFESAVFMMGTHMAGERLSPAREVPPMSGAARRLGHLSDVQDRRRRGSFSSASPATVIVARFCEVFERPDLAADPRLATNVDRVQREANGSSRSSPRPRQARPRRDRKTLRARGHPLRAGRHRRGSVRRPASQSRRARRDEALERRRDQAAEAADRDSTANGRALRLQPPQIGEHSRAVFANGTEHGEIDALIAEGVVV